MVNCHNAIRRAFLTDSEANYIYQDQYGNWGTSKLHPQLKYITNPLETKTKGWHWYPLHTDPIKDSQFPTFIAADHKERLSRRYYYEKDYGEICEDARDIDVDTDRVLVDLTDEDEEDDWEYEESKSRLVVGKEEEVA